MSRRNRAPRALADAAAVHAAREEIVQALGPLAASPLDEQATARMRSALERAESPAVRRAIRRLLRPGERRPPLVVVSTSAEGEGVAQPQAPPARAQIFRLVSEEFAPGGAA